MAFYDSRDDPSNFIVSFTVSPQRDFGIYAKGYTRAASVLAEHILAKPRFSDYEAYPIVFLYRHAFELYLKGVIYDAVFLSQFKGLQGEDSVLQKTHALDCLAQVWQRVLLTCFPEDDTLKQIITNTLRVAAEFQEIDPQASSYRYPVDTKGRHSTPLHQIVNLSSFHETMQDLLIRLETIQFGVQIEINKAQELHEVFREVESILRMNLQDGTDR